MAIDPACTEAGLNILVVEDDPETARFITNGLKRFGHDAVLAGDGESGLELALAESFHVAVVDRMLAGT